MASEEKLIERLQAYIDACSGPGITLYEGHPAVLMREALDAATAAEARVAQLETALKPFAGDKMPSLRKTVRDYNEWGLRGRGGDDCQPGGAAPQGGFGPCFPHPEL